MPLGYRVNKEQFFLKPPLPPQETVYVQRGSCLPVFSILALLQGFCLNFQTQSLHHMEQALLNNWPHFIAVNKNKKLFPTKHKKYCEPNLSPTIFLSTTPHPNLHLIHV